jgi:glycosyltransferase involved in cell wall biosynthesis
MKNNQPLLEVLIATYNRPERVLNAIQSCLAINDSRLIVSCSSNGKEDKLSHLLNYDNRLKFSYFETNQGPNKNWGKLLKSTTAKFCLLLSDEDTLNIEFILPLLDWLQNHINIASANCSILNEKANSYYYEPNQYVEFLDFKSTFLVFPEQTSYLSGYIFNNKYLKKIDLDLYLNPTQGNVYGHINLAHKLLEYGNHGLFSHPVIIKGRDDKFGGHAYEHISDSNNQVQAKLNPSVYGSYARALQFYYMHHILRKSLPDLNRMYLFFYDLDLLIGSYFGVLAGNDACGMNDDVFLEVKKATEVSKNIGEYKRSLSTLMFPYLFKTNVTFIIRIMKRMLVLIRAVLIKFFL